MKRILFCLLFFPFLVCANSNLTEDDISKYLADICKFTPHYYTKTMNGSIITDNSKISVGKTSREDINSYKSIEKYKNLNDEAFKNYFISINMTGEIYFNNVKSETQIKGRCLVSIAQDDIVRASSDYKVRFDMGFSILSNAIIKILLNKNVNELKSLLDEIKTLDE